MSFLRLICFEDIDGNKLYGDPQIESADDLSRLLENGELFARVLDGSSPFNLASKAGALRQVRRVLPVLTPKDVPIIKCVGLNYITHIKEGGRKPPPYPSIFIKPSYCVASSIEEIPIPRLAQDNQCDYEGELSIVIAKTGKDIDKEDALEYVAGYVVSNDVSARTWQRDPDYAGGVPQWCFSKGFDKYAPLGPMIVSPKLVGDASNLRLQTWVNEELRQDSSTSDLLFGVKEIISFVSQGTTLEQGTVIMTGTPAGVGMGMKPEPRYLKNGDVVKVSIEHLGSVRNKMVWA
ncbi:FAA_hydrolase domain-containing protein [Trichoderma simmonsii]|uniref:FAA_hydrolase domain-containing protein n=1 Tax=Trichoderma simmonsii TaxID=1491479 RepID=A0A8G0L8V7_9HYPO|nr:FAA_hydrolase domain-containing protein [Trichoderma simmonsii]